MLIIKIKNQWFVEADHFVTLTEAINTLEKMGYTEENNLFRGWQAKEEFGIETGGFLVDTEEDAIKINDLHGEDKI